MSTYDDSSLFLYPSGYKASVLFAQKPMDANGQLAFTRSNDTATRVASNGLIEKVRTNLATYSEQFNNAAWSKQEITVTANAAVAPDGTQSADKLIPTAVTSTHQITSATLTTLTQCAFSVFAKADGYNTITILDLSVASNGATFNVATGTVSTISGTATASIVPYGNGWYRCIVVANTTGVRFYVPTSASNFTGDGTSGVLLWGAQVEAGDIATDYIATTTAARSVGPVANIPRIDYLGGGCGKLLLEPQRTNIQLNSEDFSQSNWSKTNSAVVTNQVASPDGYVNADKLNETAVNSIHQLESSRSVSSSTVYTMSAFAKKAERSWVRIYEDTTSNSAYFNLDSGTVGTVSGPTAVAKIENYGNGWYRCSVTYTETGTFGRYRITTAKQDNEASYLGVVNNGIYVWGAQYEVGAYATSYINTLNSAVTRGADACSKTGISSLIGQTEGTLFVEVMALSGANDTRQICINNGTTSNRVTMAFLDNGTQMQFVVQSGGSITMNTIQNVSGLTNGAKIAYAYKLNDFAVYVNGSLLATDTNGAVPVSMSALNFDAADGTDKFFGKVNQTLLFKTRLPNSELASLTTL